MEIQGYFLQNQINFSGVLWKHCVRTLRSKSTQINATSFQTRHAAQKFYFISLIVLLLKASLTECNSADFDLITCL